MGDASGNPFRYTGRRFDPETGLYYYRARYYDPDLGRFLQVDPVGYEDQWNLYAYVGNNPLNATDPTGATTKGAGWANDEEFNRVQQEMDQVGQAASQLGEQLGGLADAIANGGVDSLSDGQTALLQQFESAFGAGTGSVENLQNVSGQLGQIGDRLSVSSNWVVDKAGASGSLGGGQTMFAQGSSQGIILYDEFFTQSASGRAGTLIHEGHHGSVQNSGHLAPQYRYLGTTGGRYRRRANSWYSTPPGQRYGIPANDPGLQRRTIYQDPAFLDCFVDPANGC